MKENVFCKSDRPSYDKVSNTFRLHSHWKKIHDRFVTDSKNIGQIFCNKKELKKKCKICEQIILQNIPEIVKD